MASITINLSDEVLSRLRELAQEAKVAPEELVRASVEEWLSQPKDDFARAAAYVLQKNAALYRRLA
jgi:predicted transcriptional regulator